MKLEGLFGALNISAAGLTVQRKRLNAISSNLANAETTKTEAGGPYKKQIVRVTAQSEKKFNEIVEQTKSKLVLTNEKHMTIDPTFVEGSTVKTVNAEIVEDKSEPILIYDPSHPDANADGYVAKPNINTLTEMVDMISATRSFEANANAINAAKNMYKDALEI